MFTTLLESKARKPRSRFGMAVSAATHGLVLFLAIRATLHASQSTADPAQKISYVPTKNDVTPPPKTHDVVVAPVHKGFQTLTAPVNVPDVLPDIDFSRKPTDPDDFKGVGAEGGRANGIEMAPPAENRIYDEFQVEKPASMIAGSNAPRYPEVLKAAGVEGDVLISFVVDIAGRVDMSHLVVLRSSHTLFEAAVRAALPNMRFLPAEYGGKKVRQLVQLPFVFHIVR